jgi:serine/threonine protein kinase
MKHLHPLCLSHLHDAVCKQTLGRGSYGCVKLYQCKEKCEGCESCNKMFIVKKVVNKKCIQSLLNEFSIGLVLDHPNIRKTLDIDIIDHSIIFEFCPGYDMLDYILATHNPREQLRHDCLDFFWQLLLAVGYLHDKGVAHLDLKLENIIVDPLRRQLKLIDFGQAIVFRDNDTEQSIQGRHGTVQYCPPEAFIGEFYSPEKADIWACGIILYNCLFSKFPWTVAEGNTDKFFQAHISSGNKLCNGIFYNIGERHNGLAQVLKKLLEVNPDKRGRIRDVESNLLSF